MSTPGDASASDPIHLAYQEGRRLGLATAALALSVVAFVNLLGIEKSVLAALLAVLSIRGAGVPVDALRRGRVALVIAASHAATFFAILFVFHDKLMQLVRLLQKLG